MEIVHAWRDVQQWRGCHLRRIAAKARDRQSYLKVSRESFSSDDGPTTLAAARICGAHLASKGVLNLVLCPRELHAAATALCSNG
jgi:hypothetical protein